MTKTVEIWIAMDSDGDFAISESDETDAVDNYNANYGSRTLRCVKITVNMSPPEAVLEAAEVNVPDEAGQTVTAEVA